jgi:hypothetical protein
MIEKKISPDPNNVIEEDEAESTFIENHFLFAGKRKGKKKDRPGRKVEPKARCCKGAF